MVVRKEKRKRKYFGTRRWGMGNIKNARGAGDKGGHGMAGSRKHKFTYMTAKTPELIRKRGFTPWNAESGKLMEISLIQINKMLSNSKEEKPTIELKRYKVLSNGSIAKPAIIKASGFSKNAVEKIKKSGGETIIIE